MNFISINPYAAICVQHEICDGVPKPGKRNALCVKGSEDADSLGSVCLEEISSAYVV